MGDRRDAETPLNTKACVFGSYSRRMGFIRNDKEIIFFIPATR